MSRRPVIAGNWKMHKLQAESAQLVNDLMKELKDLDKAAMPEVVVAPVFTSLYAVNKAMTDCGCGKVRLACQNCYFETQGAFTGEVSVEMAKDAGCEYIIIGHSERRQYFGETDEMVNQKAKKILSEGLVPIICCGESLEQRESGVTDSHIASQIKAALEGLTPEEVAKSIIAYEPIWAIGTGKTATSDQAEEICAAIRECIKEVYDEATAEAIRIQYGGSMNAGNAAELLAKPDIDGGLVGGASLKPDFGKIVNYNK
mgnify:CR=1 FL=1